MNAKELGSQEVHGYFMPARREPAGVGFVNYPAYFKHGLTKREMFGLEMFASLVSRSDFKVSIDGERLGENEARIALSLADALLAELSKEQP